MIVTEDYAKHLLSCYGLLTPAGGVACSPAEAEAIAAELGGAAVVKALIPTGGRGKAGGVRVCPAAGQVREAARSLLGRSLLGYPVEKVLVEQVVPVTQEIYSGVAANTATNQIDLIVSFAGGVEIETAAQHDNSSIMRLAVEPGDLLPVQRVRRWLGTANLNGTPPAELAHVLTTLYRAAADLDALLLEVNPLAIVEGGRLVALDCKLEIDDNGLARQPELAELYRASLSARERRARALEVAYVQLDGNIGVITSGAGLGMATLDLLRQAGLAPANFLDTGGGISGPLVQGALELVLEPPEVRGVIINLYGGINRMLEAAKGIVAALKNIRDNRPVVVKILGNQQEEAWAMLEPEPNVHVIRGVQTEAAVARLAELLRSST
jgi:succinyl-CoA synthetase beta subunit